MLHAFGERFVGEEVIHSVVGHDQLLGLGHQARALGHVGDPGDAGLDGRPALVPEGQLDRGLVGHDVRGLAAVADDVVDPGGRLDVLPHVVHSMEEEFDRVVTDWEIARGFEKA